MRVTGLLSTIIFGLENHFQIILDREWGHVIITTEISHHFTELDIV